MATAVKNSTDDFVARCTDMALEMLRLPARRVWVDYDEDADVLYMSFRRPQKATKTIEVDGDILVRKNGRSIVGVTISNASSRRGAVKAGRRGRAGNGSRN